MAAQATSQDESRRVSALGVRTLVRCSASLLVAAVRLRGESITDSPKVMATIYDSLKLTRMVLHTLNNG